ncbi:hypothetical protein J4482_00840 [Candidatus Woesearchaeota archaeon]|nr:hypothetical protein [Candidatus Woesearchaeota archaeon]
MIKIKDTPLSEISLRRYEKPSKLSDRELVKKFCLSIGLLQPGDSRDVIVDIMEVMLRAKQEGCQFKCQKTIEKVKGFIFS